jgi:hypothetical protein
MPATPFRPLRRFESLVALNTLGFLVPSSNLVAMLVRNNVRYSGQSPRLQTGTQRCHAIQRHMFTVMEIYFPDSDPYCTRVQSVIYTGQIPNFPTADW